MKRPAPSPITREDLFIAAALIGVLRTLPKMRPDTFDSAKGRPMIENVCRLAQAIGRQQARLGLGIGGGR